ncbi:hypothetical protein KUTeg_004541 [Tegillarca granosa]|uniref:Uncharacterized protein n=1 Tax=Tegillarca granosa TaxID=220873 RepID=A0ABQ9FT32_TEGGR|nr:hypothetical protein KUTeg_004541 [Tegillarca granosa]
MSEALEAYMSDPDHSMSYTPLGCAASMLSNRLSYSFDLKGPSYCLRNGCGSGLLALDRGVTAIRMGQCESVIVGGCNLCLKPSTSLQLNKMGLLSSEACPSFEEQISLLDFTYKEANVDPSIVQYLEACSPCTKDGDVQEMEAVTKVFCNNRQDSLLIGCVKSNIGHTEAVSGLAAIAKVILAMQDGMIPGNLHYNSTNMDVSGLTDGRLQVVIERARFEGGIVGVSSFGLGGIAGHTILKSFDKVKLKPHPASTCQRLFIYSGRTSEAVMSAIDVMVKHSEDLNLQELLNETYSSTKQHPFRGYAVLNSKTKDRIQEIQKCQSDQRPVWFVFSGMGTQWPGMGQDMMELNVFHQSIMKSQSILKEHGIDLYKLIMEGKDNSYDSVLHSFVALASIQVALVDVLNCMGIKPDGIVGHSVGELGCGYADGSLSAEETVLAAYHRGRCIQEANLPPGGMAAVGLTWEEAKQQCPEGVVAACHNAEKTVTISGPKETVTKFVQELKDKGVFARDVNSAGVAFHSYFMKSVAPALKKALEKIIVPKARGSKWISTSIPESEWNKELAKFSSADYHVNNLTSPVLFQEGLKHIPDNAVVIEIAPHCLLQAVLKRSLPNTCNITGLMKKGHEDNVNYFLSSLGKCYMYGVKVNPLGLYPPVEFPVPKSTPMISPVIKWDHSKSWNVPNPSQFLSGGTGRQTDSVFEVDMSPGSNYHHYNDHKIDGYALFPAAGYILLAWQTLAKLRGELYEEMSLVLENMNIQRATILPKTGSLYFSVSIMQATGDFEITEGGSVVVNGCVRVPGGSLDLATDNEGIRTPINKYGKYGINLEKADIYKELRLRGYEYGPTFQGIHASSDKGEEGNLLWKGDWVTFIDAMMQMNLLTMSDRYLKLPTFIKSVCIDPKLHKTCIKPLDFDVHSGIEIQELEVTPTSRIKKQKAPIVEEIHFVPYEKTEKLPLEIENYSKQCIGLVSKVLRQVIPEVEKLNLPHKNLIVSQAKNIPHGEMSMDIDQYLQCKNCGLLQLFHKIFSLGLTGTNFDNIKIYRPDQLLSYILQAKCLKPFLDVVVENCTSTNIKVLEVDAVEGSMYQRILCNLNLNPDLHIEYTAAGVQADRISPDDVDSYGLQTLLWYPNQELPVNKVDSFDLVVSNNVLHLLPNMSKALHNICKALKDGGFFLIQKLPECEDISDRSNGLYCSEDKWIDIFQKFGLDVICKHSDGVLFTLFLLRKQIMNSISTPVILKINEADYSWLETLKTNISEIQKKPKGDNLWLVADNNIYSGIVGLVNCLRNEPGAERIRCIFNADMDGKSTLPNLDIYNKTFQKLAQKNLVMNVYRNGQFGSYRHIPIAKEMDETKTVLCKNAAVSMEIQGNQSNFHWMMPPEMSKIKDEEKEELCHVFYTALNVEDLMIGTGKIMLPEGRICFGSEFSGKTITGRRIMGIAHNKALSTSVIVEKQYLLDVPTDWSLQEAASVIWAYSMAYFALCKKAMINMKTSILIQDGASDVGLAAISVAMDIGCDVFTTVSTTEKSMHIKACFPNLKDNHVLFDDESFLEAEILRATKGNGVDVVLNSEFTEDLHLNLRLLKPGGKYCNINRIGLARKDMTLGRIYLFIINCVWYDVAKH